MKNFGVGIAGILFGFGLTLSGMLNPSKVQSFLNIFGIWDPSLAFVMVGGIIVALIGYNLVFKMEKPIFSEEFYIPALNHIDLKLIGGSSLFGVGWGIGGLCPGPSIAVLSTSFYPAIIFTVSMCVGVYLGRWFEARISS